MSSPTSLTLRCLSPCKALWKLQRDFLIYRALAHCVLWSAAIVYTSLQVSWDIQDEHAFVGRGVRVIPPLRSAKAASPSVWGYNAFGRIGQ